MAANMKFDPWRFLRLIGWRFKSQRRLAFYAAVGLTVTMIVVSFLWNYSMMKNGYLPQASEQQIPYDLSLFLALPFMVLAPSFYLYGLEMKGGRVAELTLPASTGERFWSRWIANVLATAAIVIIAIFLTTLVNNIFWYFYNGSSWSFTFSFSTIIRDHSATLWIALFSHAFYLLGGTVFRSKAWAWTILVHYILMQVGTWLLVLLAKAHIIDLSSLMEKVLGNHYPMAFAAAALLCLILSRWLFGRMQIVQHKWFNL